jgi:hypothetical protein
MSNFVSKIFYWLEKNIKIVTLLVFEVQTMGVRRGGQEGALTPLTDQNSMFFDFLEENSMFLGFFRPPLENFALPWKKVCGRPWYKL